MLIAGIFLLLLVGHYLGSKPAGLSPGEAAVRGNSLSLSTIFHHPLNAPHNLLAYGIHAIGVNWMTSLRLASAIFGVIFVIFFYWLARTMFGKDVGLMGLLILLSIPIFLITARSGSGAVMYFSIIPVMAVYSWLVRADSDYGLIFLAAAAALAAYTPGLLLWVIVAGILARGKIVEIVKEGEPPVVAAAVLISVLLLVPLILAAISDVNLIKQISLLPQHWPQLVRILKNIVWMLSGLFFKTPHHDAVIIGRLPIFNMLATALTAIGLFAMWSAARVKSIILASAVLYAIIAAGINDNVQLLILAVPAVCILICAGLRYLFIEWRRVFPLNPVAKMLALSLMWALVLVQLVFGIRYALIAWPVTAETRSTYVLK
jgi:hypothetical protein